MNKYFNTAGVCFPGDHYMVDPLKRFQHVEELIEKKQYFTIHAPRQSGKTTYLYALAHKLNNEGTYTALVVSFERAGYKSISVKEANETLIDSIYKASIRLLPERYRPENPENKRYLDLKDYLEAWAVSQERPIVLLVDEIDALLDDVFVAVLRQLRDGYQARPGHFPASVALVGLRDVRDYKEKIRKDILSWGTGSPFNVKSDSLLLKDFSKEDVYILLEQHTRETGQQFSARAKEEIYTLSAGQPWLVNALANQAVSRILANDYSKTVTPAHINQAKKELILRRDTHLDSLVERLKEIRIKRIVQGIINGDYIIYNTSDDDIVYARDLGIVGHGSPLKFANPIYAEIIPRVMASPMQESIPEEIQTPWFVKETDKHQLDMKKILTAFQEFYSEHSEAWLERFEYKESAHHLLLMAFLQRIVNSGGEIIREMALGNGRIDLVVKFYRQRTALELKIKRGERSIEKAKRQLDRYLDRLGLKEGYLVIFDPGTLDWEQKIYWKETVYNDKTIIMVGI